MNDEIDVNEILKAMRENIGALSQENAVLRATITKLQELIAANPQP